jgi:hypothetical protein
LKISLSYLIKDIKKNIIQPLSSSDLQLFSIVYITHESLRRRQRVINLIAIGKRIVKMTRLVPEIASPGTAIRIQFAKSP